MNILISAVYDQCSKKPIIAEKGLHESLQLAELVFWVTAPRSFTFKKLEMSMVTIRGRRDNFIEELTHWEATHAQEDDANPVTHTSCTKWMYSTRYEVGRKLVGSTQGKKLKGSNGK